MYKKPQDIITELLKEDVGRDSYLGGIAQALKKAGIFSRYKKYKVIFIYRYRHNYIEVKHRQGRKKI